MGLILFFGIFQYPNDLANILKEKSNQSKE